MVLSLLACVTSYLLLERAEFTCTDWTFSGKGWACEVLELTQEEYKEAEILLKSKLTMLGFSRITVSDYQGRSYEHFAFNKKTLPLIHDVICALRFVYPVPTVRKTRDHLLSIENPILSQGLLAQGEQHQAPVHAAAHVLAQTEPQAPLGDQQAPRQLLHYDPESGAEFQNFVLPAPAPLPTRTTLLPPLNQLHPAAGLPSDLAYSAAQLPPLQLPAPATLPQAQHQILFPSTPSSQSNKRARN